MAGISAELLLSKIYRWHRATPQYDVGHAERVAAIERTVARHAGLHLAGAAFHGSGIPDCVESGSSAAYDVIQRMILEPFGANETSERDVPLHQEN